MCLSRLHHFFYKAIPALGVFLVAACGNSLQGDLKPNEAPETFTVVDTIIRIGTDRFNSQVQISWWGDDPDGVIRGFEYTFDTIISESTVWHYTMNYDSMFLLPTLPGQDTLDFRFSVRAVDNYGLRDPSPAQLTYPVKNSAPTVVFTPAANNPLSTFPVIRFYWQGKDPDGAANLNYYECCWNDTNQLPYRIDIAATGAIFEAEDLQSDVPLCRVYINNNTVAQQELMNGLVLNDTNVLYIRAVDLALSTSPFVASYKLFVRKPASEILLVDGYTSAGSAVTDFYRENLAATGIAPVDTMRIFEQFNGNYTQLAPDNLTQSKLFALFNTIVWFSNDAVNSLSLGERSLNDFFNNNGKLFMSVYVSSLFDEQSDFLSFTPIQSFVVPEDTTLLLTDTSSVTHAEIGYPDLRSTSFLGVVRPFVPAAGASPLYDASLIAKDNATLSLSAWKGISTVIAKKKHVNGETNFVISVLEIHKLNGAGNIGAFFSEVFINEFGL